MLRGISMLGKVFLATVVGGAVPLIFGDTPQEIPVVVTHLESIGESRFISKRYGLEVKPIPRVPESLKIDNRSQTQPALPPRAATVPIPELKCPFNVRAIIGAPEGGRAFVVLDYEGESIVLKVGETVKAASTQFRLKSIHLNYLILGSIAKSDKRTVRCSLEQ